MRRLVKNLIVAAICLFPTFASGSDAVLIEFASSRCSPCQQMLPILRELSRSGTAIRAVDVDREPELAQRYGIRQTPTFVVVSSGKELTRLVGMQSAEQLQAALKINPAGPWVDTKTAPIDTPPLTRLAPLPTQLVPQTSSPAPSVGASAVEAMPSVSVADAVQRAQAATVRLRVHDGNGHGAGTGTIIDSHGEEALVLTCGHLFRDTKGQGRIEVDLFFGGETKTVDGQLIDYDADDRDIALVAIRPGFPIQAVKVVNPSDLPVAGDAAFSFGCDRGADPTRRDTRVTGVNKYNQEKNASNLEIAGAPIDGRSGGGLFDTAGRLIGVCNAADYEGDVGIYAGPGSVHWQLDRIQLSRLYLEGSDNVDSQSFDTSGLASNEAIPSGLAPLVAELRPDRFASLDGPGGLATAPFSASDAVVNTLRASEVIVIIRDKSNPSGAPRVMTLDQPTPELLHMIESQASR